MTDPMEEELPGYLSQDDLMRILKANREGRDALRLVLREIWSRNKQQNDSEKGNGSE
jgi:hypothetical protein